MTQRPSAVGERVCQSWGPVSRTQLLDLGIQTAEISLRQFHVELARVPQSVGLLGGGVEVDLI